MPNRILKESICTSEEIDRLTWFEEVLFYRLLVNCDDYGRYDARAGVLKGRLFPLKEELTKEDVENGLKKLERVGLLLIYEAESSRYLQLITWGKHQRIRHTKEKYPAPQSAAICGELPPESNPIQSESKSKSNPKERENPNTEKSGYTPAPELLADFSSELSRAVKLWFSYKAQRGEGLSPLAGDTLLSAIREKREALGDAVTVGVILLSIQNNWKNIVWDRAQEVEKGTQKKRTPTYDLDEFEQLLNEWGGTT